jgi:hypothetical protein
MYGSILLVRDVHRARDEWRKVSAVLADQYSLLSDSSSYLDPQ